jgi:hypothetical protein
MLGTDLIELGPDWLVIVESSAPLSATFGPASKSTWLSARFFAR